MMKTVLITGGAKRLGEALVRHFHSKGWEVFFTCNRSKNEAMQIANELRDRVHYTCTTVSTQLDAQAIDNWLGARLEGRGLDLLICNASEFKRATVAETDDRIFSAMLNSNLLGPFYLAQQCHKHLLKSSGCIVNIGDVQASHGQPDFIAYCTAKAALQAMSKSLALAFAPKVRVNVVMPGSLPWPTDDIYSDEEKQSIVEAIPSKRIGDWSDVIEAIEYLSAAKFVTGSALPVDGGRAARF